MSGAEAPNPGPGGPTLDSGGGTGVPIPFVHDGRGERALADVFLSAHPELGRVCRREARLGLVVGGIPGAVVGAAFGWMVASRSEVGWGFGVIAGLAIGLPVAIYFGKQGGGGVWRSLRQTLRNVPPKVGEEQKVSVVLTGAGVEVRGEGVATTYEWRTFAEVVRLPEHVALRWGGAINGVCVPRKAFAGVADEAAWAARAAREVASASGDEATRVGRVLESASIRCGMCGYDLRGIRAPRCPECGGTFTEARLRMWAAVQEPFWHAAGRAVRAAMWGGWGGVSGAQHPPK